MNGIACIVLAAGLSQRFAPGHKLAYAVGGRPLLDHAIAAAAAGVTRLVVVTAAGDAASQALARAHGGEVAINPEPARGLGRSIACGIAALPAAAAGVFIALGDMPCIAPATYAALAAALVVPRGIVVPVHDGQWGHPVLFGAVHLAALAALDGDRGAKRLILAAGEDLRLIDVDDPGVLLDIDAAADVARAESLLARRATP